MEVNLCGLGICMMMDEVASEESRVVKMFTELPSIPVAIWRVCHCELRMSRRLRLVFDWLAKGLAAS